MKKMTRCLAVVMALTALCATVGCNKEETGGSNSLKVFCKDGSAELMLNNNLMMAFEKKIEAEKGIDFTYSFEAVSDVNYSKDILNAVTAGTLPDVIYTSDVNVENWAQKGVFENLDPYYTKSGLDLTKYDEAALEIAKTVGKDGKIGSYFAPRTYDQPVIVISNTLWKKYLGENEPLPTADENWTWTKLVGYMERIKAAIQEKHPKDYKSRFPLDMNKAWSAVYDAFVRSFGGYVYDAKTDKFGLKEEGTKKAMAKFKELIDSDLMLDVSSGNYFRSGKATMLVVSRSQMSKEWVDSYGLGDLTAMPIPIYDDAFTGQTNGTSYYSYGSVGYALSNRSKNKDLAYRFIEFVLSEEGQTIIAQTGSAIPVLKSMQAGENSVWKTSLDYFTCDQSAFIFTDYKKDKYTRIPATYARTGNPNKLYELTIYTEMEAVMNGMNSHNTIDAFCNAAQGRMERAIG